MHTEIRHLAKLLGMSSGELLRLAREVSEDGCLTSIGHMGSRDLRNLRDILAAMVRIEESVALMCAS